MTHSTFEFFSFRFFFILLDSSDLYLFDRCVTINAFLQNRFTIFSLEKSFGYRKYLNFSRSFWIFNFFPWFVYIVGSASPAGSACWLRPKSSSSAAEKVSCRNWDKEPAKQRLDGGTETFPRAEQPVSPSSSPQPRLDQVLLRDNREVFELVKTQKSVNLEVWQVFV